MPKNRRKIKEERWLAIREEFADSVINDLKQQFPEAIKWVIFSFVKEQLKVGVRNSSKRMEELNLIWTQFRKDESNIPEHTPYDILVASTVDELRGYLIELYDDHSYGSGPLCCMDDSDPNALVAYEYFWTE